MKIKKLLLNDLPERLQQIPSPPKALYARGGDLGDLTQRPLVTVVGTRKVSVYGKEVTAKLVTEIAQAGVGIISGLALGVDALAHKAALQAGAPTLAVMPCGLDRIYPASHHTLAAQILQQGGALVSEYPEGATVYKNNFIERNRLAAGLGDALLITEAAENSGTMHTARFALEQGRDVLVVPGNITSPTSRGTNNLLKSGATPVTCADDILYVLGITQQANNKTVAPKSNDPSEQLLLDLLAGGLSDAAHLQTQSGLDVVTFNQTLTMLEIHGRIRPLGNNHWNLA